MKKFLVLFLALLVASPAFAQKNLYIDGGNASIVSKATHDVSLKSGTSGKGLTIKSTGGFGVFDAGPTINTLTTTDVDTQNNTFTVAQAVGGIVVHTSTTGGGTVTTDTAAHFIAGSSGVGALTVNGQCYPVYYVNDGDQTLTFAGGTSVTVSDTGQTIGANESAVVLICRASSTTVTAHIIGA